MKPSPEPARIMPLFDEGELELAVECGAARSCALVRELMRVPPQNIIPPRYLRWTRRLSQGVFVSPIAPLFWWRRRTWTNSAPH